MLPNTSSTRLYEQIVSHFEASFLDGSLRPGDKLPSERELGEQFSVSRTVVREAIRALREKGLVDIQPGRGTFISNDTLAAMRNSLGLLVRVGDDAALGDLVQVRSILEPEIAALAAKNASDEDIKALAETVEEMDLALHDAERFIRADQEFHLRLARATSNNLIPLLLHPIVDLLWEQRKRIFFVNGGADRGQYHHKRILTSVKARNPEDARQHMREHMAQVRSDSEASEELHND